MSWLQSRTAFIFLSFIILIKPRPNTIYFGCIRTKFSIQGSFLSVVFDGTSHSGEALAILGQFVNNSWINKQ